MATSHVEQLDFSPVMQYFLVAGALFFGMLVVYGGNSRASVMALAGIYSNTLMIGVPLVGLVYGQSGQVLLFTLISLHALILLSLATLVLEVQVAREHAARSGASLSIWRTVGSAIKTSIIHPVPMPILLGIAYSLTGWGLPSVIDKPLVLLSGAFGPMALLLVGITLSQTPVGTHFMPALRLSLVKTVVHPLLMAAVGWVLGLRGLQLGVMVLAAALPIGANVFLFSQRYRKEEDMITAAVAVSTAVTLATITVVLALLPLLL
jgi:predicted permease